MERITTKAVSRTASCLVGQLMWRSSCLVSWINALIRPNIGFTKIAGNLGKIKHPYVLWS